MSEEKSKSTTQEEQELEVLGYFDHIFSLLTFTPEELRKAEASIDVWHDYALAQNFEAVTLYSAMKGLLADIDKLIGVIEEIQVSPTLPGAQAKARETLASLEVDAEQAEQQLGEMHARLATCGGIDPTEWPDAVA